MTVSNSVEWVYLSSRKPNEPTRKTKIKPSATKKRIEEKNQLIIFKE
jgi:hypothetical protein